MFISGNNFTIRELAKSEPELPGLLAVYRQCEDFLALGPVARASLDMIRADWRISAQEGCCYCGIFTLDDHLVGVVDFTPSGFGGRSDTAFLSLLMIAAPYRRAGLGTRAFRAIEAYIRRDGRACRLEAGVQVNNPAAIRFWERMGFRTISGPTLQADQTTTFQLLKEL